jgi:hypothetical protein
MKYQINGPEGFPIHPEGYDTLNEAVQAAAKFMLRFMHQGYYTDTNMHRQPLAWLAAHLTAEVYDGSEDEPEGWDRIGVVGVDSGQLLICDPCYIDSEWKDEDDQTDTKAPGYRHTDGTVLYCGLHGIAPTFDAIRFGQFDDVIPKYGRSANDLREAGDIVEMDPIREAKGEFSYSGCCDATLSEAHLGQLNFKIGHEGAGVVVSSGFGDGVYPVYARQREIHPWGRRITEMKVVMIDDAELDDEEEEDA